MKHYQTYKTGSTYGADTVRQYRDKTEVPGDDVNTSLEWQFKKKKNPLYNKGTFVRSNLLGTVIKSCLIDTKLLMCQFATNFTFQ